MKCWLLYSVFILLASVSHRAQSDSLQLVIIDQLPLDLSFLNVDIVDIALYDSIRLEGSPDQIMRLKGWLDEIAMVPKGHKTLTAIHDSGHLLTIKHSNAARLSAGRTIAPMTERLTNGIGDNITIIFDANMNDAGTHYVYDRNNKPLEFTAVQNLYHELAHAMHQMRGQWRYFASEKQAIEEENIFRIEWAHLHGVEPRLRFRSRGKAISPVAASVRNVTGKNHFSRQ